MGYFPDYLLSKQLWFTFSSPICSVLANTEIRT